MGLARSSGAWRRRRARLRIDAVNVVEAGAIDPNARKIIDQRDWD